LKFQARIDAWKTKTILVVSGEKRGSSMPKVYRSMYANQAMPRVGNDNCELGVRPPGHPVTADVRVNAAGNVELDGGGMSVFPSIAPAELKRVPKRLIPLRLAHKVPGAIGNDEMKIWTIGNGEFASGPMTASLALNVTSRSHGSLGPGYAMSLDDLQAALASTQSDWTIEEP
jgi:hypothetical protein